MYPITEADRAAFLRRHPDLAMQIEQRRAISALVPAFTTYAEQHVARAVAEGEWSQHWADGNRMVESCARSFAREAYRTKRTVEDVARKYGLIEAPAQQVAA